MYKLVISDSLSLVINFNKTAVACLVAAKRKKTPLLLVFINFDKVKVTIYYLKGALQMSFPYEKRFRHYLQTDKLAAQATETDTCHDVNDLFTYLRNFNETYRQSPDLSVLEETDINEYLIMLQTKRAIKNNTYNKVLTHLNTYFKFLFKNKLSHSLPTLAIKGLKRPQKQLVELLGWQQDLVSYLNSDQLSNYSKMVLLLLTHFYTITEIVTPGFYQVLDREDWQPAETNFIQRFQQEQASLQQLQNSPDLFLKVRLDLTEPHLSLAGLHKILKNDQPFCDLPLAPRRLYQAVIMDFIQRHQELTDSQLCGQLRLNPTSLNYYRGLLTQQRI